jgi:polysaccharide deacetylase 2 family uncharacterized protein YibQ
MGKKQIILAVCLLSVFAFLVLPKLVFAETDNAHATREAAIVIDDFGNNMEGTEEMMNLPFPITAAVMPFLPTTKRDAEWAHHMGHEVIVHMPMEPLNGNHKSWLGPGVITCDLSDDEIRKRINAAVDDVPHAIGISNHMGSKATVNERVMQIVLQVCHERGLLFLDSHTNYRSIVSKLAKRMGVPTVENRLFLDDNRSKKHVTKQIKLLQQYLSEHETCVAIGHVGAGAKKTASVLRQEQARMNDVHFVRITKLLDKEAQ